MIKNIYALQRREVERWIKDRKKADSNWALISIWASHELLDFNTVRVLQDIKCREVISCKFQDLTDKQLVKLQKDQPGRNWQMFDDVKARHIINFIDQVNKREDIETLYVHCAAGISRSGAVSLFACRYLGLDEERFKKENKQILPNFYVLSILNEESGINKDYVEWWEESKKKERERLSRLTVAQLNKELWGK